MALFLAQKINKLIDLLKLKILDGSDRIYYMNVMGGSYKSRINLYNRLSKFTHKEKLILLNQEVFNLSIYFYQILYFLYEKFYLHISPGHVFVFRHLVTGNNM